MTQRWVLVITMISAGWWVVPAQALEERIQDLSASVEVGAVFGVDVSQSHLAFQEVSPGTTKILGEGRHYNQVVCRSNSGRPWYLKAHIVSLTQVGGRRSLPFDALKWQIVDSTGFGHSTGGADFQPFSDAPALLYVGAGDDLRGHEVVLKLQYSLTAPFDAPAGSYAGQIIFTMAETP